MDFFRHFYLDNEPYITGVQLFVTMLGMGLTTTLAEFRDIARRPLPIVWLLFLQFIAAPLLALGCGWLFSLPHEIVVGLVLVMALPSGSLSNIFTLLGKGNVALSITGTCASTAACLVVTPLVLRTFLPSDVHDAIEMPVMQIVIDIFGLLLIPLALGIALAGALPKLKKPLGTWVLRFAMLMLVIVVVGALTSGRVNLLQYHWPVPLTIVSILLVALWGSDEISKIWGLHTDDRYALAVEVCMRNNNLGLRLCATMFPVAAASDAYSQGAWYVCLFSSGAMIVIAALAATKRQLKRRRYAAQEASDPTA